MRLPQHSISCAFTILCAALMLLFPFGYSRLEAEVYSPSGNGAYRCSQTGVTAQNPSGKISLRHKRKGQFIEGKISWTYSALQKEIKKTQKSTLKSQKSLRKRLKKLLNVLLTCYDAKSLPRPGSHANTTPTATPTVIPSNAPVSFSTIAAILSANCTSCHHEWVLTESYFQEAQLVSAGNPSQSTLYRILRENPEGYSGARMPPAGNALSQDQIAAIRSWISQLSPGNGGPPSEGRFNCLPSIRVAPSGMKRISKKYLENALIDLVDESFHTPWLSAYYAWQAAWREQGFVADDYSELGHERLDDRSDAYYIEGVFRIVEHLAEMINAERLRQFVQGYVPSCDDSNYLTESCRNQFLQRFGRMVFKGAFSQAHYNFYRRPDGSGHSQASYKEMMIRLMSSPYFLYDLEAHGSPVDGTNLLLQLTPSEYISRLAYTLWNSIPDNQLITYAENGTVDSNPALVVAYAMDQQSQRSYEGMKDFFEGWFRIRHLNDEVSQYMEVDDIREEILQYNYGGGDLPLITDFSDEEALRQALMGYKDAAINEVPELGSILTYANPAPVSELFRTRLVAPRDVVLARAYNLTSAWNGDLQNIPSASEVRSGILTRPAWHFARGSRKRPIIIASHIRRDLLCDTTGLPTDNSTPPAAQVQSNEYTEGTTQQRVRMLTELPGTNCTSCHLRLINPLGFAMEDFDPMGRYRRNGMEWYMAAPWNQALTPYVRPYDSTVAPRIDRNDDSLVNGTVGLGEKIADSPEMRACYVRNIVRFSLRRAELEAGDGCFMNNIFADSATLSMKQVWANYFLSPEFRLRRLDEAYTP